MILSELILKKYLSNHNTTVLYNNYWLIEPTCRQKEDNQKQITLNHCSFKIFCMDHPLNTYSTQRLVYIYSHVLVNSSTIYVNYCQQYSESVRVNIILYMQNIFILKYFSTIDQFWDFVKITTNFEEGNVDNENNCSVT